MRRRPTRCSSFVQRYQVSSSLLDLLLTPDQPLPAHLPSQPTTLRTLLTHHLDLRSPPRKSLFEWLRRLSKDEREQERLDEFISDPVSALRTGRGFVRPDLQDEIHDYATRPKRTLLETLADFRETTIPLSHLLEILGPLRRRQFSIASDSEVRNGHIIWLTPRRTPPRSSFSWH